MTPELRELYQDVILDHGKRPRNFRTVEEPTHHADGFNPLCGDKVHLKLVVEGDTICEAAFLGHGCAISTASASMMTGMLKGRTVAEGEKLFRSFCDLIIGTDEEAAAARERVGKLAVFAGVREYPARVKCAMLVWRTFESALAGKEQPVSSE
jgi:nitrogen fixation NifU-like protein